MESPILHIGEAATDFRAQYQGHVFAPGSVGEVRDIVEQFAGIRRRSEPIVIDGVDLLSEASESALLKFVEETTLTLIFLSSEDGVTPTLRSRMASVTKRITPMIPLDEQPELALGSYPLRPDMSEAVISEQRKVAQYSPRIANLLSRMGWRSRTTRKLAQLLGDISDE